MDSKSFLLSKTFWAQLVGAAGLMTNGALTGDETSMIASGIWALANVILRFLTKKPVTLT